MTIFFQKFEFFFEKHLPDTPYKYKRIDLAPCDKSIMANSASFKQFGTISRTD